MRQALLATIAICLLPLASACTARDAAVSLPPENADPALFRVADDDTVIYLFGTIHMLDEGRIWFDDAVKDAFDDSDELVIEVITPTDPRQLGDVMKMGFDLTGTPLRQEMPTEAAAALTDALASSPMLAAQVDVMEPWLAALSISILAYEKLGYSQTSGAETVLQAEAVRQNKPIFGLEDFEWQMRLFDTMPEEEQMDLLLTSIEDLDDVETMIGRMIGAWSSGDMDALAGTMNESFDEDGKLRKRLLTDRNATWAEWIDARLDQPGTVFIAVGAGHLGGEDSVQDYLKDRGILTTKIDY